ncbi:hypothetical protein Tco_0628304 [Tanacetum coccineum]|uniref:Uncharacterized protein n=1 Tax=Tanacetum coccineum TaxID=301880 RepID=A0ABQ4WPZ8_9ASTR
MAPKAVLMKTSLKSVNTARPVNIVRSVNTGRPFSTARSFNTVRPSYTAYPKSTNHCARPRTYFQNQAQSTVHRPFYKRTTLTKRSYYQRFNTGRQNVNTVRARGFNAVKPSACWVWRPIKPNGASLVFNKYNYIDVRGKSNEGFHQVIDFLNQSHICYALTKKPDVYISFIKQFWRSAEATTDDNGEVHITATINGHSKTITKTSLRRHLKLDDHDGITYIPNSKIFEQLALMGYHTDSDKLTFQKGAFSPQWRFLIHTILLCLSPKKTDWEQFSSNIATVVICLATNRRFNFSRLIFEHMVSNISSLHKFLMYHRFIQICLDMQRKQLQQHSRTYLVPSLSIKVFNNMKRPTKGYSGQEVILFHTMLNFSEPSTSPSRITSSPSPSPLPSPSHSPEPSIDHSPDHATVVVSFPSPTQPTQPSPKAEQHILTPHDSPIHVVHLHRSDEGSLKLIELTTLVNKLSERIGVLEDDLKKTKLTYSATVTKLILRVKKLEATVKAETVRKRARVVLSEDDEDVEDDSSKQGRKLSDAEVQEKASNETEPIIQEVTPTKVIQDQGSSEKENSEVSTAGATKGTASEVPVISTAEENISTAGRTVTYRRRSEEERTIKDKGKAKMTEPEPKKKSKKEIEQERLSFAKAIRLQEQMDEEQRAHIVRDEEIARQKDRNFNQHIEPMEHGSEKMKSPEKIEEEDVDTQKEMKEVSKESGAKRKKSLPRKSTRSTVKRQKMEEDAEKDYLKGFLDIVPREEVAEDVESLSTKYPIVDWKTCVLTENFMYYQIFRGDGSSKNYKILSEMLEDFDRQDVMDLHRLVNERYSASRLEEYDLMLWGDLHTLFEPDEEDEIWKNQHEYNVISWSLYDFCGIHILLMQNGIAIHMLTEKKYPLSQEMITKMLNKRLAVDQKKIDQGVGSTGDEHLDTNPETESDKLIKSSVENLVPTPSESEDLSDIKSKCNMPVCDDSTIFSNPLFDVDNDFSSSDDKSFSDKDVSKEIFKIFSNPLSDEEITSTMIDPHHFNAESDLIDSLLNRDTLIISSSKIDSLLEEFSGELAHTDLIPPGINEADFDPEEDIRLVEKLLYDNSSPL